MKPSVHSYLRKAKISINSEGIIKKLLIFYLITKNYLFFGMQVEKYFKYSVKVGQKCFSQDIQ